MQLNLVPALPSVLMQPWTCSLSSSIPPSLNKDLDKTSDFLFFISFPQAPFSPHYVQP